MSSSRTEAFAIPIWPRVVSTDAAAMLAQGTGKTAALCVPDGAFLVAVQGCKACITLHADRADDSTYENLVRPRLAQWLDFCDGKAVNNPTTSSSVGALPQNAPTATPSALPPRPSKGAASGRVGGASSAALMAGVAVGWVVLLLMGLA